MTNFLNPYMHWCHFLTDWLTRRTQAAVQKTQYIFWDKQSPPPIASHTFLFVLIFFFFTTSSRSLSVFSVWECRGVHILVTCTRDRKTSLKWKEVKIPNSIHTKNFPCACWASSDLCFHLIQNPTCAHTQASLFPSTIINPSENNVLFITGNMTSPSFGCIIYYIICNPP